MNYQQIQKHIQDELPIAIYGSNLCLYNMPHDILNVIARELTYDNPKYLEAQRAGRWTGSIDKYIRMYTDCLHEGVFSIPRGFPFVDVCQRYGFHCEMSSRATDPFAAMRFQGELRSYQAGAVDLIATHDNGILVAPTGSGKSVMACALIAQKSSRTLILTHTRELLYQWQANIKRFLHIDAGIIGDGKWVEGDLVTIGTIQTLRNKPPVREYGTVIVDEVHHAPALTWARVLDNLSAKYRYGLSATPWRKDGLQFVIPLYFGPHRVTVPKEQIENIGGIVPAVVYPLFTNFYADDCEWRYLIDALMVDAKRNRTIASYAQRLSDKTSTLVLTERIEHAKLLAEQLPGSVSLHGELKKKERTEAFEAIKSGTRITVATSALLGEGVDIEAWGALIFGLPMGSRSPKVLQAIGRVVRPAPGKNEAIIVDLIDNHPRAQAAWRGRCNLYKRNRIKVNFSHSSNTG
jgi:superfamily II DNA or RNA helicase